MAETLEALARRCWKLLELIHRQVYFTAEPRQEYRALGLNSRQAYFASRSAPLGPASAELVSATFYAFSPDHIATVIPSAWEIASPARVLDARHRGVTAALRRQLHGARGDEIAEAAELAGTVTAGFGTGARPLYAGHAALPWPEDPLLALWHAATLVREHRGDGHTAVLLAAGISRIDACVTGAVHTNTVDFHRAVFGWTEEQWTEAVERLCARGLLDSGTGLAEAGHGLRGELEERTDAAAFEGWPELGLDGAHRLVELLTPMVEQIKTAERAAG